MINTQYYVTDKARAVYDLQLMLRAISEYDENIPTVLTDGIYGDETRISVTAFQSQNGLPPTGSIDFNTHRAIVDIYSQLLLETDNSGVQIDFSALADNQISSKERSEYVIALKLLLSKLSVNDSRFETEIDAFYDDATAEKVLLLQEIFGHEQTGAVDLKFWKALEIKTSF